MSKNQPDGEATFARTMPVVSDRSSDESPSPLQALDQATDHVAVVDRAGRIRYANRAFSRRTGIAIEQLIGRHISTVWSMMLESESIAKIRRALDVEGHFRCEYVNRDAFGDLFFDEVAFAATKNAAGDVQSFIAIGRDVTSRNLTDPLTGLSSRTMLVERIAQAIRRHRREPHAVCALAFLDVDRFQEINDSYGFAIGDRVITELARRIQSSVREVDLVSHVGRLHRDEFSVLLEGLRNAADAQRVVERIQECVSEPIVLKEGSLILTVSSGITLVDSTYSSAEDAIRDAETAMKLSKRNGCGSCRFFEPRIHEAVVRKLRLAADLRQALEKRELLLHYQPIVSLNSGQITGVEALVRWQHPSLGFLPPPEFISIAEETGLIAPLGSWVLREACRQLHAWHQSGHRNLSMSVNVSARQFRDCGLAEDVAQVIENTGIEPSKLKLEVTETTTADNPEEAARILTSLKDRGVEIMLDDFGTGYSSLNFLTRFPVDRLKIDRSFVQHVPGSRHDEVVATTIAAMGKSLGIGLLAEGVETLEQLAFLRTLACDEIQGYLFSAPVDASRILGMLESGRRLDI